MPDTDLEPESELPPGIGPVSQSGLIRRRPEPLWIVALVIVAPLLIILIIFLVRLLTS